MSASQKSAARIHSRDFEKLSVEFVRSLFRLEPDIVYVTQPSKDGGFDGFVQQKLHRADSSVLIEHTLLLEAKLRGKNTGLGLRDFASTLVIAFNNKAQTLVVVTNQSFTKQACENVCLFMAKTNLQVRLVDGATISGWIRRKWSVLLAAGYNEKFLKFLLCDSEEEERRKKTNFECNIGSTYGRGLAQRASSWKIMLETGWNAAGEVADCEVDIQWNSDNSSSLPALIGDERNQIAHDLANNLCTESGIVAIKGAAGVGKSVVIAYALQELSKHKIPVGLIDVGRISTSRLLFIEILSVFSGLDFSAAFDPQRGRWDPTLLLKTEAVNELAADQREVLISVLGRSSKDYHKQIDLNAKPLLDYLEIVTAPHAKRQKQVLVFHELNRATEEVLEFLFQATVRLSSVGVNILVELRDQGYLPVHSPQPERESAMVMAPGTWEQYVRLFERAANIAVHHVKPLRNSHAISFLNELLPNIGQKRAEVIRTRVGNVPLYLQAAATWLKESRILDYPGEGRVLIEDLERFFEGISPDSVSTVLDRLLELYWNRTDFPFRDFLCAVVLLNGRLSTEALIFLTKEQDPGRNADRLFETGLFAVPADDPTSLELVHDLLRERLDIFAKEHPISLAHAARLLKPHLNDLTSNKFSRKLISVAFYSALGCWNEVYATAYSCGRELERLRQWGASVHYLSIAHEAVQHLPPTEQSQKNIRALVELLDVEVLRYRLGKEKNAARLEALKTWIGLSSSSNEKNVFALRLKILEWRFHYVKESFAGALQAATEARVMALNQSNLPIELRGKALANYAVTLKVMDRKRESFQAFDEAQNVLPDSITIKAERLSNIAAFSLRDNPKHALHCYLELLKIAEGTEYSFSEIVHANIDVAMARFLMQDYTKAKAAAQRGIALAADNGIPAEEARARNIMACSNWATSQLASAEHQLDLAAFASERSFSRRFLWRMRVNQASVALELGHRKDSHSFAISAQNLILKPRLQYFSTLAEDRIHITSRWYAALLCIAKIFASLDKATELAKLYKSTSLPLYRKHATDVIEGRYPEDVFARTTHLQAGRIMITG